MEIGKAETMNSGQGTIGSAVGAGRRVLSEEVPVGYKRTEVGVIPEDWNVRTLGALGEFKNGINKDKQDFGHGFPFVNLMDVFGIPQVSTNSSIGLVNSSLGEREAYALQSGDVLFVRSSVKPEGVGLTTLILEDLPNTVFSGFLIRYRDKGVFELEFKEHCFQEASFRNRLIASSTVSANTNINQESLKSLKLSFPPNKSEQRAIAEALSDVDGLLAALETLIAKKRAVKQAAMQQLLTGKSRLPGFSGVWETKLVSDFGKIVTGPTPRTEIVVFWGGRYPWITPTDISFYRDMITSERMITKEGLDSIRPLPPNTVLVTCIASIGKNAILKTEGGCNQQINAVIPNAAHSAEFLYYLFELNKRHLLAKAGITATNIVSKTTFSGLGFEVPFFDEQCAIATILSDMDAQIAALERRRDKTRVVKQGMMQQLLTGRVRLVKSEVIKKESEALLPQRLP